MFAKIKINGEIELVTGMHIGASSQFSAIGAVDSPIVRDADSKLPMIPGSSLKGKLRTLLSKMYTQGDIVCKHEDDPKGVLRLFGSAKKNENGRIERSRIIIGDMFLSNEQELRDKGAETLSEVKFENTINRITAVANPRQIERAIKGSKFKLDIIYDAYVEDEIEEDIKNFAEACKLLKYDYLGGNGSRGYGKVKFNNLSCEVVIGDDIDNIIDKCNDYLKEV